MYKLLKEEDIKFAIKVILLFVIILLSSKVRSQTIALPYDFESAATFTNFDGGTGTVIANPVPGGINTSANVGRIIRNGGQPWAGAYLTTTSNVDFSTNPIICMKVYTTAPIGTPFNFKVEPGDVNEIAGVTTVSGAWETLYWDFTGVAATNNRLVLLFDIGTVGDGSATSTVYFDDIQQVASIPTPCTITPNNATFCPTSTVNLSVVDDGGTYDWYTVSTGGAPVQTNNPAYTTPALAATTTYYVENTDVACPRQAVTATASCVVPCEMTPNDTVFCPTSTANLSVDDDGGIYDWYDASSGGTLLQSNSDTYTTPAISATTTYYVENTTATTGAATSTGPTVNGSTDPVATASVYFTSLIDGNFNSVDMFQKLGGASCTYNVSLYNVTTATNLETVVVVTTGDNTRGTATFSSPPLVNGNDYRVDFTAVTGGCSVSNHHAGGDGPTNPGPGAIATAYSELDFTDHTPLNTRWTGYNWNVSDITVPCPRQAVTATARFPSATIAGDDEFCAGFTGETTVALSGGVPDWSFVYAINGDPQPAVTGVSTSPYTISGITDSGTVTLVSVSDDVSCAGTTAGSATMVVDTGDITANHQFFCPSSTVNLSVVDAGGTYDWYTDASGGAPVETNNTDYTTPVLAATTTYYVEDASVGVTVGPNKDVGPTLKGSSDQYTSLSTYFTSHVTGTMNSVDFVQKVIGGPATPCTYTITLFNITTGMTNEGSVTVGPVAYADNVQYEANFAPDANIVNGNEYEMRFVSNTGHPCYVSSHHSGGDVITSFPNTDDPEITFTSHSVANQWTGFDWNMTGTLLPPCPRTPVVATADCAMPVDFFEFAVNQASGVVSLDWSTLYEVNSDYFIITRSGDGVNFTPIGQVQSVGNTTDLIKYNFLDENPLNGISYYQLVQYDFDGSYSFSDIVSTNKSELNNINVYPNPTNGLISVENVFEHEGVFGIVVFDAVGKEILKINEMVEHGHYKRSFDLVNYPNGVYTVQVLSYGNSQNFKIVKN